jgi:hypothetical protein
MRDSMGKLVSTQYLMTSVALANELSPEAKDDEIRQINSHLRRLMDSFHQNVAPAEKGADSPIQAR